METVIEISGINKLRKANKAELAEIFEVSIPSINGWVRRGCPVVKRGDRTNPWVFDAIAVAEWRLKGSKAVGGVDPEDLPPTDRRAWFESETKRRELQVRDHELITTEEIQECLAMAFAAISQEIQSIPDNLERRAGISSEVAEQVESVLFNSLQALHDRLSTLGQVKV